MKKCREGAVVHEAVMGMNCGVDVNEFATFAQRNTKLSTSQCFQAPMTLTYNTL